MEVKRLFDLLDRYNAKFPKKQDALSYKVKGEWVSFSSEDYQNNSNYVSYALLSKNLERHAKIGLISNNRPEWNFVDMGSSQAGFISVPIYPTLGKDEYSYILEHAEIRVLFLGNKLIYNTIKPIIEEKKLNIELIVFDNLKETVAFSDFLKEGREKEEEYKDRLEKIKAEINEDDLFTIIYTSGTTGFPKGVMLSHKNIISNAISTSKVEPFTEKHRTLSFLPLNHVYERMMNYHFQYKGLGIYYAENMGKIRDNLQEIKPQIFNSVPRLLEKVYDGIIAKGKNLPIIKKAIFFWSVKLGERYDCHKKHRLFYNIKLKIARKLVFSKWQEALGGNLKAIVSGGAALQPRLERIFGAAGIQVCVGYGLTETSPVISVNWYYPLSNYRYGTVGKILENIEVKIADDGEILARGQNIMIGYYKDPELSSKVIDNDGWFHTGDIGELSQDNFLRLTDRKKEIFKLSAGKYIAPQAIENKLKESFFIEQAMVCGENEKFTSALISPNFAFLHDWCSKNKIQYRDNDELIQQKEVIDRYQKEINQYNQTLAEHEKVKRFKLVKEEWSPNTGELSPTLKLKRNVLSTIYAKQIEEIYQGTRDTADKKILENGNGIKLSDVIKQAQESPIIKANFGDREERKKYHDEWLEWRSTRRLLRTEYRNKRRLDKANYKNKRRNDKTAWKNQRHIDKEKWLLFKEEFLENKPETGRKVWKLELYIEKTKYRLKRRTERITWIKDRKIEKIEWRKERKKERKQWRKNWRVERVRFKKNRKIYRLTYKINIYKLRLE